MLSLAAPLVLASAAWSQVSATPPSSRVASPQPLPAAQPTRSTGASLSQGVVSAPDRASRARVTYRDHQLSIAANGSSLNGILREIAKLTGMKITGGVNDERVYGNYGPDSSQQVLNQLLDGTGTNVMLLETPEHTLAELVLSPRSGGATPPSPNAAGDSEGGDESLPPGLVNYHNRDLPLGARANQMSARDRNANPANPPGETQSGIEPFTTIPGGNNGQAQPDSTQQSPNGVKTPEQIYDELNSRRGRASSGAPQTPD